MKLPLGRVFWLHVVMVFSFEPAAEAGLFNGKYY